jgi:hypothetical protein
LINTFPSAASVSLQPTCFLDYVAVEALVKLPSSNAYDAPQRAHRLAIIPDQSTNVVWMDVNAENEISRAGEQYDTGFIRMIYERADYIQQHLANLTFCSGVVVRRRYHATPLCLRSKAREFSQLLLISNTAQVRVYSAAPVSIPPIGDSTQRVRATSFSRCFL